MKTLLSALCFVLTAAIAMAAESSSSSTTAKSTAKEEIYELPTTGVNQPRPDGRWINVEAVGIRLVLKFFDKEKKPMTPDLDHGTARFKSPARNPTNTVLNRDGLTLTTPAVVRPPHNYLVILNLFTTGATEVTESYTIKYP